MLLFPCTCASLGTPFPARGRMSPPLLHGNNNVRELSVKKTQSHNERSTARLSDLRIVFQQTTNSTWKACLLLHVRATITTPGLISALARINLSWPRTLFCEAITVPPKCRGCDCLGTHFRRNRGVDKHAAMHPPQTSTQFQHPSHMFDKFEVTVSPAQWGFAFAHDGGTHAGNASPAR